MQNRFSCLKLTMATKLISFYFIKYVLLLLASCSSIEFCTPDVQSLEINTFYTEVYITSPQYPNNYNIENDCEFPFRINVKLPFAFHLMESRDTPFTVRYQVSDMSGSKPEDQFSRWSIEGLQHRIVTLSRVSTDESVEYKLILPAGQGNAFSIVLIGM